MKDQPKTRTEYAVQYDNWYRGVNGKKIEYRHHQDAVDLNHAKSILGPDRPAAMNARIVFRTVTDWQEWNE